MAYSKQNFQNGQTLDAANLETMENGIIAGQGVKNLLINSNFKDPINSSGKTSWSSSGFTIDKWRADSAATINLTSSGITVDATSVAGNLQQNIDNLPNGTYTFAALVNNVIRTIAFTNNNGTITTVDNSNASFGDSGSINAGKENSAYYVQINNAQGHTNTIAWAALYEGNYTVDTLPNYIPKDKHIEMINCGISLQPQNLLDNSNFSNPVNSRGKNTYSDEGNEYTIDRWKTKYKSNISIENGYINIFGRFGLDQYIQNPKDGIYTFAARVRINSSKYGPVIYVDDNSGSSNDLFLDANIGEWKTYILQHDFSSTTSETITFAFSLRGGDTTASISVEWAAMYKGAYTADTLPPYIPKGKHVEMLNCGVPISPKNVLKNSDFTNPLNTKGFSSISSGAYTTIDCWNSWISGDGGKIELTSSGIKLSPPSSENIGIYQQIENYQLNKIYTVVVYIDDLPYLKSFQMGNYGVGTNLGPVYFYSIPSANVLIRINSTDSAATIQKIALYEGAYTLDTIPMYQSESRHVEMLNCGVQLNPRNLLDNSDFTNPVNSQGKTSWTNWNNYTVDRWIFRNNHVSEASVGVSGMSITTGSKEIYFEQPFDKSANQSYIGKSLTLVFSTNEGLLIKKWTVVDGSYSREPIGNFQMTIGCLTNFWVDLVVPANKTINIYWAALYEGSYTADTLPPYVPKGKHVEMLNCGVPLQPHNLLDNSDFRIKNNIINTKGLTDYSFDSDNVFDRWRLHWTGDGRVSIKDGYIELYRKTNCTYLFQHPKDLESMIGKTYTVAAKVRYNGYIGWIDSTQRINCGTLSLNDWDIATCIFTVGSSTSDIGKAGIEIATKADLSFEVQWVALYEGAYTKETLPAYVPKGKHVEMLNCGVPLAPHNLLDNSDFRNPVNQRGQSSYSAAGYTIDRWNFYNPNGDGTVTINNGYVSLTGGSGAVSLSCRFPKGFLDANKTYTSMICDNLGNINPTSLFFYDNFDSFEVSAGAGETKNIAWAALYEGAYDASTLPAYVPKGYAAELAECQRYYWRYWQNNNFDIGHGYMNKTDTANITFDFPVKMRVAPTISIGDISTLRVMCVNGLTGTTSYSVVKTTDMQMMVGFTLDSTTTVFTPCVMRSNSGTTIEFSADL